jgi:hypothetical protein
MCVCVTLIQLVTEAVLNLVSREPLEIET